MGSHGFPPTQARFYRAAELIQELFSRGAAVDVIVLIERGLRPFEEEALGSLRAGVRELEIVEHPSLQSLAYQAALRAGDMVSLPRRLGGRYHCPGKLLNLLRRKYSHRDYAAVIAGGVHLARVLPLFPSRTERLIDIQRIWSDAHADHSRQGRGDALSVFADAGRELFLLAESVALLVACAADAARLRQLGFRGDMILTPPSGSLDLLRSQARSREVEAPLRPPRVLCVGSDTTANLDGVRWFRRQVFPRIIQRAPTCRLRLVGEVARHIEPGPGVDRMGWVDHLREEYRRAAVVALPLRMGSGLHRRAAEALMQGKALATTRVGAYGIGLAPRRDAIVADDPAQLAEELGRALGSDPVRQAYEARAQALARDLFDPSLSFERLAERLGLTLCSPA
jgi:hypothetical protein